MLISSITKRSVGELPFAVRHSGMKRKTGYKQNGNKKKTKKNQVIRPLGSKAMESRLMGPQAPVKLHYSTRFSLNPGVLGAVSSYVFRLSSIFDPDFTGVGHQPVGHDQYAALYERYQVYEVEYHVEFANRSTTQNQTVGYRLSDVSNTSVERDVNIENGNCEWTLIGAIGAPTRKFTGSVYLNNIHGLSYQQYMANDDYGAQFGNNPAESGYLVVWAGGLGDDTDPVDVVVHMVYKTKLMGTQLTSLS